MTDLVALWKAGLTKDERTLHLAWKIEAGYGGDLEQDEKDYLVGLVRAQIRKPRGRPATAAASRRKIAVTVLEFELECGPDCKHEAAVQHAMSVFGCGREHVFACLRELDAELQDPVVGLEQSNVAGVIRTLVIRKSGKRSESSEIWPPSFK